MYLLGAFVALIIGVMATEYPIFGITLLLIVIAGAIWFYFDDLEFKNLEEKRKKDEEKEKIIREGELTYEEELKEELLEELEAILKKEIKVIATAYRKSVTSNSFGKKNYNKFVPELLEFLEDNSNVLKELGEYHDDPDPQISMGEESINFLISRIEEDIEKLNSDSEYSEDMDPFEYEHYCASEFNKTGWEAKATQGSSDQGVDVKATKNGIVLVAQCKKFAKPVGNKAVQEVVAGMKYYEANKGVVIAPNGFTNSAEKLAQANNIKLIHHNEIKDL